MGVAATDPVNERRGADAGYGATGRLPGVQRTLTKVSNRRRFPAMPPLGWVEGEGSKVMGTVEDKLLLRHHGRDGRLTFGTVLTV
jgi:hypothetical protein